MAKYVLTQKTAAGLKALLSRREQAKPGATRDTPSVITSARDWPHPYFIEWSNEREQIEMWLPNGCLVSGGVSMNAADVATNVTQLDSSERPGDFWYALDDIELPTESGSGDDAGAVGYIWMNVFDDGYGGIYIRFEDAQDSTAMYAVMIDELRGKDVIEMVNDVVVLASGGTRKDPEPFDREQYNVPGVYTGPAIVRQVFQWGGLTLTTGDIYTAAADAGLYYLAVTLTESGSGLSTISAHVYKTDDLPTLQQMQKQTTGVYIPLWEINTDGAVVLDYRKKPKVGAWEPISAAGGSSS